VQEGKIGLTLESVAEALIVKKLGDPIVTGSEVS